MFLKKNKINAKDISGIGIYQTRGKQPLFGNKTTGEPIHNAIVWQDRRTARICDRLKKEGHEKYVRKETGLVVDAYFSGTKVKWLLDNVKGARKLAQKGELLFGTIDTWLVWKLTGGKAHITDYTNASRTLLYNIRKLKWDTKMLKLLNVPESVLPTVKSSSEVYGHTNDKLFGEEIAIAGIAGDQQAALFGQVCHEVGIGQKHLRHRLFYADEYWDYTCSLTFRPADNHCLGNRWRSLLCT